MKLIIRDLTKTYKNGVKAIDFLNLDIGKGSGTVLKKHKMTSIHN
jgi:hypothetical protein